MTICIYVSIIYMDVCVNAYAYMIELCPYHAQSFECKSDNNKVCFSALFTPSVLSTVIQLTSKGVLSSYRIVSYLTMSYLFVSCLIVSYLVVSYLIVSYLIVSSYLIVYQRDAECLPAQRSARGAPRRDPRAAVRK